MFSMKQTTRLADGTDHVFIQAKRFATSEEVEAEIAECIELFGESGRSTYEVVISDPTPYLNPNNGERTSFPHAVSIYAPRTEDDANAAYLERVIQIEGNHFVIGGVSLPGDNYANATAYALAMRPILETPAPVRSADHVISSQAGLAGFVGARVGMPIPRPVVEEATPWESAEEREDDGVRNWIVTDADGDMVNHFLADSEDDALSNLSGVLAGGLFVETIENRVARLKAAGYSARVEVAYDEAILAETALYGSAFRTSDGVALVWVDDMAGESGYTETEDAEHVPAPSGHLAFLLVGAGAPCYCQQGHNHMTTETLIVDEAASERDGNLARGVGDGDVVAAAAADPIHGREIGDVLILATAFDRWRPGMEFVVLGFARAGGFSGAGIAYRVRPIGVEGARELLLGAERFENN